MNDETADIVVDDSRLPAVRVANAVVTRDELTVEDLVGQADKIKQVMGAAMKEDVHYGKIPGVNKPTLLKPGAEMLNVLLRLAPSYVSERVFHDTGHLTVVSKCTLTHIPTGFVIAEGEGLCSSREAKYAYRRAERLCPMCGEPQVRKGKGRGSQPGNWYCWKKMGGCGETWALDSEAGRAFEMMETGRQENPDLPDTWNTVLKMADKRALVAAVLNGTGASDIFTQDMEDGGGGGSQAPAAEAVFDPGTMVLPDAVHGEGFMEALGGQLAEIGANVDWAVTLQPAMRERFGVETRAELSGEAFAEYCRRMSNFAAKTIGRVEVGAFPPASDDIIKEGLSWAFGMDGTKITIVRAAVPGGWVPEVQEALDQEALEAAETDGG